MDTGLAGRTVLVTGASRNMARATALAFAAEGANLAICTSTRVKELEEVADQARQLGVGVLPVRCDVSDGPGVEDFVRRAAGQFGSLDVVVNMAGDRCEMPFLDVSLDDWNRTIAVNLTGPYNTCRSALPYMIERRWGRIINVSGIAPYAGGPAAKTTVKLGIVGMTRGLAKEFGAHNITANCVGPGYIARESATPETAKPMPPDLPMGRRGSYAEIVSLVIYLASENAGFITGQSYLCNGGAYFS